MAHFVYIIECVDGSYYTGYATDVARRMIEHNGEGAAPGARYTRGRQPVVLRYQEELPSRSAALKREYAIKQLTRSGKEQLWRNATA